MSDHPTCSTCRFWESLEGAAAQTGACREASPQLAPDNMMGMWPWVHRADWCGKHKPAPKADG